MPQVARINPQLRDSILDPHTREVIQLLDSYEIHNRIVGGAVRNMLLGKIPRDVDLVADADPSELIYVFEKAGIPVDLGGISHGTVKAVFGHGVAEQKVDVSSLGYRIRKLGSHLHIERAHNWKQDAELRDLTINALSLDHNGIIHDYVGGYDDLLNQIVKLPPKASQGLTQEPVGIMRYFRALAFFPNPKIQKSDLQLIQQLVPALGKQANDKKVQMNLIAILNSDYRNQVLKLMCELNVHKYVPAVPCSEPPN